jgi:hypothetical protein
MSLNKKQKILVSVVSGLILLVVIGIITINLIVGNIIETKIKDALKEKDAPGYSIELRKVNANILTGNINLKDVKLIPDSLFLEQIKKGEGIKSVAMDLHVGTFRLAGIGILKALRKDINIDKILFKKAKLKIYVGKKPEQHKEKPESVINLDSIYMKGMDGVMIGGIEFIKCQFEVYNLEKDQLVISSNDLEVEISEIALKELDGNNDYFKLHYKNIEVTLEEEKINLPDGNYYVKLGRVYFNLSDSLLEVDNLIIEPTYEDKYELARKLKYTSEIFDVTVKKISILQIDISKIVENGQYFIDSVKVDGLDLNILMDKRLPFNEDKRPKLPNETIKNAGIPIFIKHIGITNSRLNYQEKMENSEALMTAVLGDLDVQVSFITSITDSIATGKSMVAKLRSNFMEKTPLSVNFDFPLYSKTDTFYFSGHLASAKMKEFNKASFPAMGVKFVEGDLKGITFSGSANSTNSKGEMTMLYDNLQAEVDKKDPEKDKNKFLSWIANTVVHTSNPGKNNKLRIASMEFERIPYKGFGNYVWKTLQSGIVATVTPTGKKVRTITHDHNASSTNTDTDESLSKKEARKKAREEKKDRK